MAGLGAGSERRPMTPDTCTGCGHPLRAHFKHGRKLTCDVVCLQLGPIARDGSGSTRAGATPIGGATRTNSAGLADFQRGVGISAPARTRWLTTDEAAVYLRFERCKKPRREFLKWVHQHGVGFARRGRVLLFDPRELDAAVNASNARRRRDGLGRGDAAQLIQDAS
jgi:hypothetical protein